MKIAYIIAALRLFFQNASFIRTRFLYLCLKYYTPVPLNSLLKRRSSSGQLFQLVVLRERASSECIFQGTKSSGTRTVLIREGTKDGDLIQISVKAQSFKVVV
jgi:hypothetical protein